MLHQNQHRCSFQQRWWVIICRLLFPLFQLEALSSANNWLTRVEGFMAAAAVRPSSHTHTHTSQREANPHTDCPRSSHTPTHTPYPRMHAYTHNNDCSLNCTQTKTIKEKATYLKYPCGHTHAHTQNHTLNHPSPDSQRPSESTLSLNVWAKVVGRHLWGEIH